jgi:hypothetical protein
MQGIKPAAFSDAPLSSSSSPHIRSFLTCLRDTEADKVLAITAIAKTNARNREEGCAGHGRKEAEDGIETILQRTTKCGNQ